MRLSIVLPTYNVSKYIDRSLSSCVKQTCADIEIIVVDDCGQDDSIEKAYKWAEKDSRVKVIHNTRNLGTFHARKAGVENASGDYILFLDPDDEIELNTAETLLNTLTEGSDLVFYGSKTAPARKSWQRNPEVPILSHSLNYDGLITKILKSDRLSLAPQGKVIKKDVLQSAYELLNIESGRRMTYGEDVLLFTALLMVIRSASSIADRLYIYYRNESSITELAGRQDVLNNVKQLDDVMGIIDGLCVASKTTQFLKNKIESRLAVSKIKLLNRVEPKGYRVFMNYLQIIGITKSPRDALKLLIFLLSIGRKAI